MKRVLTLSILILIIAASAFAQSIVEVADSSDPVVDLGTGKSTSTLVSTAFDGDGTTPPEMPADFQDRGFGGRGDVGQILQMLIQNSKGTELPQEVTITGELDSETAIQAMLYLLGNYVDFEDFKALFQRSMENGEFEMPQGVPQGTPGGMTPPQGGPVRN